MVRGEADVDEEAGDSGTMTLVLFLTLMWGVVGFFIYWYTRTANAETEPHKPPEKEVEKKTAKKPRGMGRGMGRGGNDVREATNTTVGENEDDEEDEEKLSKKEQRARDKKERQEEQRKDREESEQRKLDKRSRSEAKYAERDREREEMEEQLRKEEEEREAERQKKEQEEFDSWKDMFSVGDAGNEADLEAAEAQGKLGEFIQHIETQKVVAMEDLAAHFDMRPQDVLRRVEDLLSMDRLSGVIDDRGKFIVVTPEEMQAVVKFIRRRGRVNVTDLASESNKLIDLTPKPLASTPAEDANPSTEASPPEATA